MAEKVGGAWVDRGAFDSEIPAEREADFDARGDRRRGGGLTGLVALAISGVVLYLAWCVLWERSHPANSAARGVKSGDAAARLRAIADLEQTGPQDQEVAVPALIGELTDLDPENRAAAAAALVTVVQGVGGKVPDSQQVNAAVAALMGRLEDPNATVRARAMQALWTIVMLWRGSPRVLDLDAIAATEGAAADDSDVEVRLAGVRGLGVVAQRLSEDPPPRLVAALGDESESVRDAAAQTLAQFSHRELALLFPSLVKSLESARPDYRPAYFSVLKQIGPPGHPKDLAREVVPALVSALGSRDREVRCLMLSSLREFGTGAREAIPALIAVLGERAESGSAGPGARGPTADDPVAAAAAALAKVAGFTMEYGPAGATKVPAVSGAAVPALLRLLESPVAGRRLAAVNALQSFEPDDALIAALIASSRDRDPLVRAAAISALRQDASKRRFLSLEAIRQAMEDDSPKVREAAANTFYSAEAGVESMVPILIRHALHDPDRSVRDTCAYALGSLKPPAVTAKVVPMYIEAIDRLGAPVALRSSLIDALIRFGPEARGAVPAIARALRSAGHDSRREVRYRMLITTNVPSSDAELAAERDAMARVELRRIAARALGQLAPGTPWAGDAVSALASVLDDANDGVTCQAVEALAGFGPEARPSATSMVRALRWARHKKNLLGAGRVAAAMGKIAPAPLQADEAVAFLDEVLRSEDFMPRLFAERALGPFGPAAAPAVPRLVELSRRPALRTSQELASVATTLGQIAPGTSEEAQAVAALLELLQVEPELRQIETVIEALVRFGPKAAAALPRLHEMTGSGNRQVSEAARRAVAAIGVARG